MKIPPPEPPDHCGCDLPKNHFSSERWHFWIPLPNQCWLTPGDENYFHKLTTYQSPILDDESKVRVACRCTYKIYRGNELIERGPKPNCQYSDRSLAWAYEVCPRYRRAVKKNRKQSLTESVERAIAEEGGTLRVRK